jgi:hypothetical protein
MKPFAIVIHFNVLDHLVLGIGTGFKAFAMDGFDLKAMVPEVIPLRYKLIAK